MNEQEIKDEFTKIWNKIRELESKFRGEETDPISNNLSNSDKKCSIKEFLISVNPNNDVKRAVCIGYYLEKSEGKKDFANKDIIEGFRRAKCKVPLNVPDKIQKAISNGWFDYGSIKGAYTLTVSGEKVIETKFSNSKND